MTAETRIKLFGGLHKLSELCRFDAPILQFLGLFGEFGDLQIESAMLAEGFRDQLVRRRWLVEYLKVAIGLFERELECDVVSQRVERARQVPNDLLRPRFALTDLSESMERVPAVGLLSLISCKNAGFTASVLFSVATIIASRKRPVGRLVRSLAESPFPSPRRIFQSYRGRPLWVKFLPPDRPFGAPKPLAWKGPL